MSCKCYRKYYNHGIHIQNLPVLGRIKNPPLRKGLPHKCQFPTQKPPRKMRGGFRFLYRQAPETCPFSHHAAAPAATPLTERCSVKIRSIVTDRLFGFTCCPMSLCPHNQGFMQKYYFSRL